MTGHAAHYAGETWFCGALSELAGLLSTESFEELLQGANSFAVAEILTGTSGTRGARYPSTASWASCLRAELVGVRRRRITTNSP